MMRDKALIVSRFWAGIMSTVVAALVIGGFAYAWNANAQTAVLQRDVAAITNANLDIRLTRMEEQLKNSNEKLDQLLRARGHY